MKQLLNINSNQSETSAQVSFSPKKRLEQCLITSSVEETNLAPRKDLSLLTSDSPTTAQLRKNKFSKVVQWSQDDDRKYILFCLNDKSYAIDANHVLEVLKMPELDYPQKLPRHLCGLLNYNNLTINIVDINKILELEARDYTIDNYLLVLKTEESIFGVITDDVVDIISIPPEAIHPRPYNSQNNFIKFITYIDNEMVFIFDLYSTEKFIKENENKYDDTDTTAHFPHDERSKTILQERKKALMLKAENITPKIFLDVNEFVWFTVGDNNFCINIEFVQEIVNAQKNNITKIPCTPIYISGMLTLRGDFFTVIDMNMFLELPPQDSADSCKKIIVINHSEFKIAFLISDVENILTLSPEEYSAPQNELGEAKYVQNEFIKEKALFRILDMKKILNDGKLYIKETV